MTGPDGLLKQPTKTVLEAVLNAEMTEHLGHAKHQAEPSRDSAHVRNGTRSKTVISDAVGEISAHFAEVYGASVSKEAVSRITDQVLGEMAEWQ